MTAARTLKPRKSPRQRRSAETVDAICQAAAHILETEGATAASTNRIAAVAGVSIGSLYQYFPNREALLIEVAKRHFDRRFAILSEVAVDLFDKPVPVTIRQFADALFDLNAREASLHQAIVTQALTLDIHMVRAMQKRGMTLVRSWLELHRDEIDVGDLDTAAFLLLSSVESATHRAVFEQPELLQSRKLAEEVVRWVSRYLGVEPPPPEDAPLDGQRPARKRKTAAGRPRSSVVSAAAKPNARTPPSSSTGETS